MNNFYNKQLTQLIHVLSFRDEFVDRVTFKERNDNIFQLYELSNKSNNIEKLYGIIVLEIL